MDEQTSLMYQDMSERDLLKWALDYTMPWVIQTFKSIPDDRLALRPRPRINAPAWVFAHIAVTERKHVGLCLEGIDDIPKHLRIFHTGKKPTEDAIRQAVESKDALISYWREVRAKTHAYLDRITDADLKEIPQTTLMRDNENPVREWFVMTIQHQNAHWGQLSIIAKLITAGGGCRKGSLP